MIASHCHLTISLKQRRSFLLIAAFVFLFSSKYSNSFHSIRPTLKWGCASLYGELLLHDGEVQLRNTPLMSSVKSSAPTSSSSSGSNNNGAGRQGDTPSYSKTKRRTERFVHPQVFKMFHRAQHLLRNGENTVARRLLVRCLELNPFDSHSWLALARLEVKLGNLEMARKLFIEASIRCPNNVHLLHARGHMEQKHGDEAIARECWSHAMVLDPTNDYVCHALSNLEIRHRNYDAARQVLEKVILKKPTATLCVTLSELERQVGKPERAKEILLHGLRVCKRDRSKLLLSLAWLEEDFFGNSTNAMKLFDEAMSIDSANVRVYVAKANMELRLHKISEARDTLRKASKLDADDGQHYTMWATLEIEAGNYDVARKILMEGSLKYPGDHFLLQRWGTLESKHGNTSKARELFEKSITIKPHAPTFVAWALLEEEYGVQALKPKKKLASRIEDMNNYLNSNPSVSNILPTNETDDSASSSSFLDKSVLNLNISSSTPFDAFGSFSTKAPASKNIVKPTSLKSKSQIIAASNEQGDATATTNISAEQYEEIEYFLDSIPSCDVLVDNKKFSDRDESLKLSSLGEISPHFPSPMSAEAKNIAAAQFEKARQLFNFGMVLDPYHGPLYHAYGNFELGRGNITGARNIFMKGVSMNCSDATSLYHAWGLLELKLSPQTAREIFHKGIELGLNGKREVDSGVGFLLHSLGMLELDCGKTEEAKRVFSTGVSLFPQHSHLLLGLAQANFRLGNSETSREQFRAAVDADPFHAHAWQSWAVAEKQSGNIELARVLFRQGLKKGPNHGALWQAYAIMEMQQGNFELARTLFAQGLKRCPTHAQSYQAWACLEVRLGDLTKAKALVQHGLRQDPSHPALWSVAGHIEERLGDVAQARNIFEMALRQFPRHGPLYKGLGELEARQGAYLRARECFSRGLQMNPQYPSVYHAAALLEAKLGNLEGLAALHSQARERFQVSQHTPNGGENADDVIERIKQLEVAAHEESLKSGAGNFGAFESVYSIFSAPTR